MKIKWLGHAAFMITSDTGIRIITDPYEPEYVAAGGLSYGEIRETADIVTVSHEHADHNNVAAVRGNPQIVRGPASIKGIEFTGIPTYHDEAGGSKRGNNMILCFEVDGIRVCHLGDLGHRLRDTQVAELGKVDILLIPVGGFFTITARVATEVCNQLRPRVIIPMHYKTNKCGFPLAGVDEFLLGKADTRRLDTSEVEFKPGELPASTQIVVLTPAL
jgi:L-ascorbate metabolism protein UlaG (beta-lactamase superfamily)